MSNPPIPEKNEFNLYDFLLSILLFDFCFFFLTNRLNLISKDFL